MLSSTLRAAVALALVFAVTVPAAKAETIECRAKPETGGHWSWREIDGRRCWYEGRSRVSKELLSWGPKTPAAATKPKEATRPTEATKPAEAVKPAEATKPTEATKPAAAVKPAEAIKLETTAARTPPQTRPGEQSGIPGQDVAVNKHPATTASPLIPFETAWQNAIADLMSQYGPKPVRTITVRSTD